MRKKPKLLRILLFSKKNKKNLTKKERKEKLNQKLRLKPTQKLISNEKRKNLRLVNKKWNWRRGSLKTNSELKKKLLIEKLKKPLKNLNMTKLSEMVKTIRQMSTLLRGKPMQKEQHMKKQLLESGSKNKPVKNKLNKRGKMLKKNKLLLKVREKKLENKQEKIEKEKKRTETIMEVTIEVDMETKIITIHRTTTVGTTMAETEVAIITTMETVDLRMITTTWFKNPKVKEKENLYQSLLLSQ